MVCRSVCFLCLSLVSPVLGMESRVSRVLGTVFHASDCGEASLQSICASLALPIGGSGLPPVWSCFSLSAVAWVSEISSAFIPDKENILSFSKPLFGWRFY